MICQICNTERQDLSQHIKEHGISVSEYKKKFNIDSVIDKELRSSRRQARKNKYKCECPVCKEKFKSQKQILRHAMKKQDSEHSKIVFNDTNSDEWIECKICGLRRKKLLIHIREHNISKEDYEKQYGPLFSDKYKSEMIANGSVGHKSEDYIGELNPFYGRKHSRKTKDKISNTIKINNKNRSKHFNKDRIHTEESKTNMSLGRMGRKNHRFGKQAPKGVSFGIQGVRSDIGHYVRSTLEANYARYLQYNNIKYLYELQAFLLKVDNREMNYWPDFYLVETDEYVELKNYKRAGIDKVELTKLQYPEVKIRVLYQNSDEWKKIDNEYSKLIDLWENSKKNLRLRPELYVSQNLKNYQNLLQELINIRQLHNGKESNQEDVILEKMDKVWNNLTKDECEYIQSLPTYSIIQLTKD